MSKTLKRLPWLSIFIIVSMVHISGFFIEGDLVRNYTKPLLLISLGLYYFKNTETLNGVYLIALCFSFLGDVFLISNTNLNFMLGLGSFLLSHVFYSYMIVKGMDKSSISDKLFSTFPFLILLSSLLYFLKDNLGDMLLPVVIYGIVIAFFGTISLLNFKLKKSGSAIFLLIGSVLFIVSDSILAINKFHTSSQALAVSVMLTYIVAQFLICKSVIKKIIK